ncbi:MAG: hypothetical protein ACYC5A_04725 [Thermoleophilia bacterium]
MQVTTLGPSTSSLISERSLFGNSFEEVWATSSLELDSHYWWPVYDGYSAGMKNWVLVSNPGLGGPVDVKITIHIPPEYGGDLIEYNYSLGVGETWAPQFPGLMSGPVEVKAWRSGGSENNPFDARYVIASQRVLYKGAFNEMPGIPASGIDSAYVWTWYDSKSPGADNWILISNPDQYKTAYVTVGVGYDDSGGGGPNPEDFIPVAPHETLTLKDDTIMDGPVVVWGCYDPQDWENTPAPFFASQRLIWGSSFSEIAGTRDAQTIGSTTNWTWYDQQSPGTRNWVLISNLNDYMIYAEIKIAGHVKWQGYIDAYHNVTPTFPGAMGGPVEVQAWTDDDKSTPAEYLFASQRVLWNGYFNEIVGKGL